MFDDEPPKAKPESLFPRKIDELSVSDLKDYICDLENEIIRVVSDIEQKKASQNAAASFFK